MIVTLTGCKDNLPNLGINIDISGNWDKLRDAITTKVPLLSSSYDITDDILTIEVADGTILPDLSEFGMVNNDASTTN